MTSLFDPQNKALAVYGRDLSTPRNRITMALTIALLFLPISDIPRCGRPRLHGNRSFFLGIYTFYLFPLFSRALSSREHLEIERAARKSNQPIQHLLYVVVGLRQAKLPSRLPPCVEMLLMISSSFSTRHNGSRVNST